MLKSTHIAVACAASLAFYQASSIPLLVAGTAAAALGGMLPDIDSDTSGTHKESNKVIGFSILVIGAVAVLDHQFGIGIYDRLIRHSTFYQLFIGFVSMIVVCAFGKEQPHRGFMHSFAAWVTISGCVGVMFPSMVPPFAIGFFSHLAIDLLNRKGEKLFWPSKQGFCLRLCRSNGILNQLFLMLGMLTASGLFLLRLLMLLHLLTPS